MTGSFDMVGIVDLVIAVTVIECGVLLAFRRRTGRGVAVRDFLANMVSGLCLMLALRCMATEASPVCVAGFLAGAGAAHFVDIAMRWRRGVRARASVRGVIA